MRLYHSKVSLSISGLDVDCHHQYQQHHDHSQHKLSIQWAMRAGERLQPLPDSLLVLDGKGEIIPCQNRRADRRRYDLSSKLETSRANKTADARRVPGARFYRNSLDDGTTPGTWDPRGGPCRTFDHGVFTSVSIRWTNNRDPTLITTLNVASAARLDLEASHVMTSFGLGSGFSLFVDYSLASSG